VDIEMGRMTTDNMTSERASDLLAAATAAFEREDAKDVAAWTPQMHAYAAELTAQVDFARRLRAIRASFRLSQRALATIIDEDQGDISRLEHGELNPGVDRMNRILGSLRAWIEAQTPGTPQPDPVVDYPMIDAATAAGYLCATYDDRDREFTMLKLQKLLYYAQGICLAVFRRPLFDEPIKHWTYGPVVPSVRKMFPEDAQLLPHPSDFDVLAVPAEARAALDRAYALYGGYAAWALADMTHQESPWVETADGDVISRDAISAFFSEHVPALRDS
jgi:uncharacterized phage-associated protein/DNA-binding XRE family transcriptional regulator